MSNEHYGAAFRQLRTDRELSQENVADMLKNLNAGITSKYGVSRLESRGSDRGRILHAYSTIFNKPVTEIEALAAKLAKNKLP